MDAGSEVTQIRDPACACSRPRSRSSAAPSGSDQEPRAGELEVDHGVDKPLLGAVVQITRDAAPCRVRRLHYPPARGAQLRRARLRDVTFVYRALHPSALLDIGEGHYSGPAAGSLDRGRGVGDETNEPSFRIQ